ncbi:MAG: flagellar type III secretion system protein FliR [Deltaproteobacteria bacterium]|nr:flagellar type III secretion system protein FliR [Deltaproteobacteria bacterium]
MTTFYISLPEVQIFLFIFLRVSAIMMTLPLFDSKNIPPLFKIGLSFSITIILFPVLKLTDIPFLKGIIPFGLGVASEIMLGAIIGLSVKLIFAGIQLAGQVAGFQMGLAIANVLDPVTQTQNSIIAQFKYLTAMLIFLALNAHHWFLRSLVASFRLVPPFDFQLNNSLMKHLMLLAANMFVIAIKVGAPIIVVMLLTSVALGLVARTVPQMNIFVVAMPLKIVIGLIFLGFMLPYLSIFLSRIFNELGSDIITLLKLSR